MGKTGQSVAATPAAEAAVTQPPEPAGIAEAMQLLAGARTPEDIAAVVRKYPTLAPYFYVLIQQTFGNQVAEAVAILTGGLTGAPIHHAGDTSLLSGNTNVELPPEERKAHAEMLAAMPEAKA